ncbi:26169_t:CDS:2 [Gigaspora margarita]|uniref:Protein PNS1 n=1 Tax=Gigaspora margarita TaxID=4874 RepID=A0ABN7V2I1_GIGMA|nr:26169_t:CDS:2 [Gigaspora margarita]
MSQPYYPPPPPPTQPYYSQPAQQQYYPPQTGGYSPVPPPAYEQGSFRGSIAEKWNPKPKYQDLWAILLFLAHLVGFVILSYFGLKFLISQRALERNDSFFRPEIIPPFIISGVIGLILSVAYMFFMQRFPLPLIKVTLYLSIAMYFVAALVFFFFARSFILAIIFVVFGILYLIAAFSWRNRIPFAAVMLETVVSITRKYYGIVVMGFIGLVIQVGWSVLWILSLIGAFYWTSQVIKTIVHVTASGVYATYYFLEGTTQGTGTTPTLSSFKRATTTSIGSICFGSLIIALLNTARAVLRTFADSDDGACGFLACCIACLLAWIESLDRGVEAIINDDLIGNVLTMGSLLIGVLCGLLGFLYINYFLKPLLTDQNNTTLIIIFVIICFAIGFMMCVVITDAISSGVSTTFVALAEDPDALRRTKPVLFEKIRQQWPRVVQGI